MSSDWKPSRTPLFGIALIPPRSPVAETTGRRAAEVPPGGESSEAAAEPPTTRLAVSSSCGWTAVAESASSPVSIAVVTGRSPELWPERWLHPNERLRIARLLPYAMRESLAVVTAARRALASAWRMPAPALACFDLSPLLDGVQSLRLGDWTVQRVPAPAGVHVAAAAPGAGWTYSLLPRPRAAEARQPESGAALDSPLPEC